MTATTLDDSALKARHRTMWALGDYATVAADLVSGLGPLLVEACGVRPGHRVLDIAAGPGNAAIAAAQAGATVIASDLTPELLTAGQADAESRGIALEWRQADAEALPFADDDFDVVMSCLGVMFAPRHQVSAGELLRVCRPGGTIGLLSWTPQGFIGQMLAAMKDYAAPPPAGALPPPLWGDEDHVRSLLGDRVTGVSAERRTVSVDRFARPEEFRDYFKSRYGPTIAVYRGIADQPERGAALDQALADLAGRHGCGTAGIAMEWEYLLVTARKR